MARKYDMRRRAERVEETRRRITEAAVALHGSVGPARTTISAVAEAAGVDRLTVYRHFPDEHVLFQACTSHWLALNPFPDLALWAGSSAPPAERLEEALRELYGWYRSRAAMMDGFLRDAPFVPALSGRLAEWEAYQDAACDILAAGWGVRGMKRELLRAAVGHALDFRTWASLAGRGLDDEPAAALMTCLVIAAPACHETRRAATRRAGPGHAFVTKPSHGRDARLTGQP